MGEGTLMASYGSKQSCPNCEATGCVLHHCIRYSSILDALNLGCFYLSVHALIFIIISHAVNCVAYGRTDVVVHRFITCVNCKGDGRLVPTMLDTSVSRDPESEFEDIGMT